MVTSVAMAQNVTFDFKSNPWGCTLGSGTGATAEAGNISEITQDGVVLTFDIGTHQNTPPRMWNGPHLRVYKGNTVTLTAPAGKTVVKAVWTATGSNYHGLAVDGEAVDASAGWSGTATEIVFDVTKNSRYNTLVVTLLDEGEEPAPEEPVASTLWSALIENQGEFYIDEIVNPSDSIAIWNFDAKYGMVAKGYINGASVDSESWLISPVLNLANATDCTLSFEHAANYFSNQENFLNACKVLVKEEGVSEWDELEYEGNPTGSAWTFVPATADLASYAGKAIQVAFVYTSTTELSGTWEVTGFAVKGFGTVSTSAPTSVVSGVPATVNADSAVYSLDGRRVANPTKGLYIINGKKVVVK